MLTPNAPIRVYREPAAAEPQPKPDPTADSRSSIRRQPRARPSRRYPHFERAETRSSLSDIWHMSARPSIGERRYDRDLPLAAEMPPAARRRVDDRQRSNAAASSRPRSRRGPSISDNNTVTLLNTTANAELEHMPPLRRMSNRNVGDELQRQEPSRTQESANPRMRHAGEYDGLGERERSDSPMSALPDDEPWSNISFTIVPDANLPSASTSFASQPPPPPRFTNYFGIPQPIAAEEREQDLERDEQERPARLRQLEAGRADETTSRRAASAATPSFSLTPGVLPGDDFTTLRLQRQAENSPWNYDSENCPEEADDIAHGAAATESESEGDAGSPNDTDPNYIPLNTNRITSQSDQISEVPLPPDQNSLRASLRQECENLHATLDTFLSEESLDDAPLPMHELRRLQTLLSRMSRDVLHSARRSRGTAGRDPAGLRRVRTGRVGRTAHPLAPEAPGTPPRWQHPARVSARMYHDRGGHTDGETELEPAIIDVPRLRGGAGESAHTEDGHDSMEEQPAERERRRLMPGRRDQAVYDANVAQIQRFRNGLSRTATPDSAIPAMRSPGPWGYEESVGDNAATERRARREAFWPAYAPR